MEIKHSEGFLKEVERTIKEKANEKLDVVSLERSIKCLIEADVKDDKIIEAINRYWAVDKEEIIEMIAYYKPEVIFEHIVEYFKLQGKGNEYIREYRKKHMGYLKNENELWNYKNQPEKIIKELNKIDRE